MSGVPMTAAIQGLTCQLAHGPSGSSLTTVPPRDNGGDGSSFSPTDLVGAALAACALSTMALVAKREGLAWGDARAAVEKRMTPPPRRIGELVLAIDMPREARPEERARLEEIARTCPVARSLHPDVKVPMEFRYPAGDGPVR
ncbi:OsmC family protein [Anaeromyxobacter sp. SG64]|uniref:OsmC family protein n=1 Tax=Anaeromyxobacter sp. SG64 TaxID=2925409 RepID=UPI001F55F28D|nr:OsmC family protein [Anaeromyxobacter sp. SG64]